MPESRIWPYVQIARVDHWFKSVFMLLGVVLAFFYRPALFSWSSVPVLILALLSANVVASSNYVINELVDAPWDRHHPSKRHRPAATGKVRGWVALFEWLSLGVIGLALAFSLNVYFGLTAAVLWLMGLVYNLPPIRTKEVLYIDVLSESVNNPLRLLLGWFALIVDVLPPLSIVLSYWMAGAYLMAMKRLAEYRSIGDKEVAARYRRCFAHYEEDTLLVSILFYATACALFAGIFIVRYHVELVLFVPLAAGFFAYYMKLGLMPNSPVQNPEKLYRVRGFFLYSLFCTAIFIALMFTEIPALYYIFKMDPSTAQPLLRIGGPVEVP